MGFYDDGIESMCATCDYTCRSCAGRAVECITCPLNSFRNINPDTKACDCPLGYADNEVPTCLICDPACKSCQIRSDYCISCETSVTSQRAPIFNNTCPCNGAYYDNGTTSYCLPCLNSCLTCAEQSTCKTCNLINTFRTDKMNGSCPCNDGYYDDFMQPTCVKCHFTCHRCLVG